MPRLKLTVQYDGTDFVGWQIQPNGRSVQQTLEAALSELLSHPVRVSVAGRTDAGVHALGQVVAFDTKRDLPLKAYVRGLNGLLPPDVSVAKAEVVDRAFDPRRWSEGKTYRYLISNAPHRNPLRRRTHWELFLPLDAAQMQRAAPALLGRHDFSSFRAANCQAPHALREVRRVDVIASGDELAIWVEGTAFLKHMVRNIVGTLVEVGRGKRPSTWVAEVLAAKDRTLAGATAPPQGLTLVEVRHGDGPHKSASDVDDDDVD